MTAKFIIVGMMGELNYFVKLTNNINAMGGFTFQGLRDNATKFIDYQKAVVVMKYISAESKLPLSIITV